MMIAQLLTLFFLATFHSLPVFAGSTDVEQWLLGNGCAACHVGKGLNRRATKSSVPDCNSCHVRIGITIYQHAPALTFTHLVNGELVPTYTKQELSDFLRHPVKRRPQGLGEMSPVSEERITSLLALLEKERLLKKSPLGERRPYLAPADRKKKPELIRKKLLLGERLYQRVLSEGLTKSCRHCHSNSRHAQEELLTVFGSAPRLFFLESDGKNVSIASSSRPVLNPGPGCSDSLLLHHLEERRRESIGEGTGLTGMPLSVAPLSAELIDDIRLWSTQGCPSPKGLLCSPCEG